MGAAVTLSHYKSKREKTKTPKFIYNLSAALQLFIFGKHSVQQRSAPYFLLQPQCFCNLKGIVHPKIYKFHHHLLALSCFKPVLPVLESEWRWTSK